MRTTLFRRVAKPALCCAVPEGEPVPSFLRSEAWEVLGSFGEEGLPLGFHDDPARYAFKVQGFYVFTDLSHRAHIRTTVHGDTYGQDA